MSRRDSYEVTLLYGHRIEGVTLISDFGGEYAFLSNFWVEPFDCGGRIVPSAEHAYQAQKASKGDKAVKDLILAASHPDGSPHPGHAKRLGRRVRLRPEWDDVKVGIMRRILAFKFAPKTELAEKLIATFPAHLVEGNTWGDTFWGCVREPPVHGTWIGANHLGLLLMEIRDELMKGGV